MQLRACRTGSRPPWVWPSCSKVGILAVSFEGWYSYNPLKPFESKVLIFGQIYCRTWMIQQQEQLRFFCYNYQPYLWTATSHRAIRHTNCRGRAGTETKWWRKQRQQVNILTSGTE